MSLVDGNWTPMASSNVTGAQYNAQTEVLTVKFHGGMIYRYGDVSPAEAMSFDAAGSKGGWVWDHLRVRGPGNAHQTQKPFGKVT